MVPWPPQGVKIFSELLLCIWKADILTDVLVSLICLLLQGVSAKNWEGSRESDFSSMAVSSVWATGGMGALL